MTDATVTRRSEVAERSGESWIPLFALGFAAGIGAMVALSTLQDPGTLTGFLRSDRLDTDTRPSARISLSMLPTGTGVPSGKSDATETGRDSDDVSGGHSGASQGYDDRSSLSANGFTVAALEGEFDALNYRLGDIRDRREPVPRITAAAVPGDLDGIVDVDRRKAVFLRMVLPLVLLANEQLEADRNRIQDLRDRLNGGDSLSNRDDAWLSGQFTTYRVEPGDWELLLRRVDIVPPSLALAQAAIESGWGTSRFAREGNALFGQWVWGEAAKGLIPEDRQDGMNHKIRAFESPLEAVTSYIRNLNTHRAYRHMRDIRATMRSEGRMPDGHVLAEGLEAYSEKGRDYIDLVRDIIAANDLRALDHATLRNSEA